MEAMRQSWTDDRLDEFGHRIDERFDRVDERFVEVDKRFEQVDKRFDQMDKRFDQMDKRFDQMDKRFGCVEGEMKALSLQMNRNHAELRTEMTDNNRAREAEFSALYRTLVQFIGGLVIALLGVLITQL